MARACYPVSVAGATPDGDSSGRIAIFQRANVDLIARAKKMKRLLEKADRLGALIWNIVVSPFSESARR